MKPVPLAHVRLAGAVGANICGISGLVFAAKTDKNKHDAVRAILDRVTLLENVVLCEREGWPDQLIPLSAVVAMEPIEDLKPGFGVEPLPKTPPPMPRPAKVVKADEPAAKPSIVDRVRQAAKDVVEAATEAMAPSPALMTNEGAVAVPDAEPLEEEETPVGGIRAVTRKKRGKKGAD